MRIGYLQIVDADNLTREALALTTKSVKRPERGLIFDADGNKLVGNISKSDIYIDTNILAGAKDSQKERQKLRRLALKTLDMTEAKFVAPLAGAWIEMPRKATRAAPLPCRTPRGCVD